MKVVAVIPAYNEEKTIRKVIKETKKFVDEVIVVDDGSTDKTKEIIREEKVKLITHKKNEGYGKSLIDGIKEAIKRKANYIITLDADGQHSPRDIPRFVKELGNGYDVVIGSRFLGRTSKLTFKRNVALRLLAIEFFIFTGLYLGDVQSGYRGYREEIIKDLEFKEHGMGFSVESLIKLKKVKAKFKEIPIEVKYFRGAKTFFSVVKQGIEIGKTILKYF
jgi:glycosyltransferase involved in cell wall biosynthesis